MLKLNKEQKQAVEYLTGPLLVIAGAGTGKTRVITEKIDYIVSRKNVNISNVLALTFTDKAANEMIDRLETKISSAEIYLANIFTFHTFCRQILNQYGLEIGLPINFNLITEEESLLLLKQELKNIELKYYQNLSNPNKFLRGFVNYFHKCKDELISPEDYLKYAQDLKLDTDKVEIELERDKQTELANLFHLYNQALRKTNHLDFSDLIFYVYKLFTQRPNVLKKLQEQYKYILVDEFQDVNFAQYELVKLLTGQKNQLTVVGDDDQSIYAFRGANIANIMRFKDDFPQAKEIVLTKNYRSRQEVLDLAYQVIIHNNPFRLEEKLNLSKKLVSHYQTTETEPAINYETYLTSFEEAEAISKKIFTIRKQNPDVSWDDFAVLIRSNSSAEILINSFKKHQIPFEFLALEGLFKQDVVLYVLSFLRLIAGQKHEAYLYRLLHIPSLNITSEELHLLAHIKNSNRKSLLTIFEQANYYIKDKELLTKINKLNTLLKKAISNLKTKNITQLIEEFLEEIGYLKYLLANIENSQDPELSSHSYSQIQYFKQFIDTISNASLFLKDKDTHVFEILNYLDDLTDSGELGKLVQLEETKNSVNIITVHKAKGLEFKYVFVPFLVNGKFPSRKQANAFEIPYELLDKQNKEIYNQGQENTDKDFQLQEERRLFYVAVTRAKDRLFLSNFSFSDQGSRTKKPSVFLEEAKLDETKQLQVKFNSKTFLSAPVKNDFKVDGFDINKLSLPKSYSFTALTNYNRCPYAFLLENLIKLSSPIPADNLSFGTVIHNVLLEFYKQLKYLNEQQQDSLFGFTEQKIELQTDKNGLKIPSLDYLLSLFKEKWQANYNKIAEKEFKLYKQKGLEILKLFYEKEGQEYGWSKPVYLEKNFTYHFNLLEPPIALTARIDRVDKLTDGTLHIIDYKTGKPKDKLSSDDKRQLMIYYLVSQSVKELKDLGPVSLLSYYYIDNAQRVSFKPTDKDLEKTEEFLKITVEKIRQRDFSAKPSKFNCQFCSYRQICSKAKK